MKPNIVFLDEYTLGGADLTRLHELGRYTGYSTTAPDEVADRCRDAEIVITNKVVMRRETLAALPGLRLICIAATGMNNIDLDAAAELGIAVRNAAGYSTHSVAETTLGAAIALRRHIVYYDRYVKSGAYSAAGQQFHFAKPTHQLYGSKWGIVGLGAIGHEVARLAAAFGCEVRYTSTSGAVREEPYPAVSLPELLGWADTVSVHAPLNDHTRGLIGAPELAVMKQSAILVNVARGGIVDEAALAEALDRGSVAGAALDVFSREPLAADNPLLSIREPDRLLLSPHNAWSPREAIDVLVGCIAENIEEFCKARSPWKEWKRQAPAPQRPPRRRTNAGSGFSAGSTPAASPTRGTNTPRHRPSRPHAATGATTDRSTARTSFSATTKATATTSYVSTANGTWPSTTWNTA